MLKYGTECDTTLFKYFEWLKRMKPTEKETISDTQHFNTIYFGINIEIDPSSSFRLSIQ